MVNRILRLGTSWGGAAYTGPGDIVSGCLGFWGPFAVSAAYAAAQDEIYTLVDQAGANETIFYCTAAGLLDVAAVSSWVSTFSVTTIKVKKVWDHTGNARHFNQATLANMPKLVLSGVNSLPTVVGDGSNWFMSQTLGSAQAIPFTIVGMFKPDTTSAAGQVFAGALTGWGFGTRDTGVIRWASDANIDSSVSADTNPHAVIAAINSGGGTNSILRVGAVETTGDGGTRAFASNEALRYMAGESGYVNFNGKAGDLGYWPGGFDATQRANMIANITSRWVL